jgi:hypothetical protein
MPQEPKVRSEMDLIPPKRPIDKAIEIIQRIMGVSELKEGTIIDVETKRLAMVIVDEVQQVIIGMPYDDYEWREMYWSEIEEEIQKL